jgi:hypothetical protein
MASVIKGLIECSGITNVFPENPKAFKQLTVQENITIPSVKPDVEQLLRVIANVEIIATRVIKTPVSTSQEGQVLTGYKLLIEGELNQKIEYVADEPTQSVHAAHFNVPFSTFIILPADFREGSLVTVVPYIEDIYIQQLDKRNLFKNVVLFLNAVFC